MKINLIKGSLLLGGCVVSLLNTELDKNYVIVEENNFKEITQDFINNDKQDISYEIDNNIINIYDNEVLDQILIDNDVTYEDVIISIKENNQINSRDKDYMYEYVRLLENAFPNIDLRVFNENIKRLSIKTTSREEMTNYLNESAYAYFQPSSNEIVLLDNYDDRIRFKQSLFHEITHMLNYISIDYNNYKLIRCFYLDETDQGKGINEAITSYITNKIFFDDSYTVESNQMKLLMNCFSSEDEFINMYVNGNIDTMKRYLMIKGNNEEELNNLFQLIEEQKTGKIENNIIYYDNNKYMEVYRLLFNCCYNTSINNLQNMDFNDYDVALANNLNEMYGNILYNLDEIQDEQNKLELNNLLVNVTSNYTMNQSVKKI